MAMAHVGEPRPETDTAYRFRSLAEFIGFNEDDIDAIHASAPDLGPRVPALVDAVYDKLFSYDSTKRHFVPRESGYEEPVPESLDSLSLDHPMIAFRQQHPGRPLTRLVTGQNDGRMVKHLDMVGRIRTPEPGSADLDVPLVQMNALLGFDAMWHPPWHPPRRAPLSRRRSRFPRASWSCTCCGPCTRRVVPRPSSPSSAARVSAASATGTCCFRCCAAP